MTEIYTPNEWYSVFGGCPRVIIDEYGAIFRPEDYFRTFTGGAPLGKIDLSRGLVYGPDLGAGLFSSPIGTLVQNGGVTEVYAGTSTAFARPILYIKNDRIYTPDEYFRLVGAPSGYIRRGD